jgi:hypothetical protein
MITGITNHAIRLLVDRKWPMVPSAGQEKRPRVPWKRFQQQLPTVDQLREWNRKFKPERWGLVTGKLAGVVVVDFDGDEGIKLMREWRINPHVRTGSGGFHWYGIHPGWRVPTLNAKTGKLSWPWPGVDVRGDGGFAVLLGRNINGQYVQLRDLDPEPFDALPSEVRTFLRNHRKEGPTQERIVPVRQLRSAQGNRVDFEYLIERALAMASQNGRNNWGFWLACQLRDNGYDLVDAGAAMRAYGARVASTNTKGKVEPYADSEITASLREAYSWPARSPWNQSDPHQHDGPYLATGAAEELGRRDNGDSRLREEKPEKKKNANDPDNLGLYVDHAGGPEVGHRDAPLSRLRFARIPIEVVTDPRLAPRDVRVYAVLAAGCWQRAVSEIGKRLVATRACCAGRLAVESLRRLETAGHIQKLRRKHGQRGQYILLSPVFGQGPGTEGVSVAPSSQLREALPRKDPRTTLISGPKSREALESLRSRRSTK